MNLCAAVGIDGPLDGQEMLLAASYTDIIANLTCEQGSYVIWKKNVIEFIKNCECAPKKIFIRLQHNNKIIAVQLLQNYVFQHLGKLEN